MSKDEEEIVALIHRNRIAVWTNDFDLWDSCFVQAPYTTRWGWWRTGGVFIRRGWELMRERMRSDHPPIDLRNAHDTKVTNLVLRIANDMAWASFDQEYPSFNQQSHVGPGIVHEMRVFERHEGEWKVAFLGFLDGNSGPLGALMMRLDPDANVLWQSPEVKAALAESDDLIVRAGKLRFRDTSVQRKFQEAVRWAAGLDTGYMSKNGSVPIVVEAGDGIPTHIYWVIADAGMIMFSFGDQGGGEKRLDVAALIYGLSPAQKQLAALVAEGLSLNEIAKRMGITANTARTHLNRVFDKTGVRTQPALVRVLLSSAAPV